MVVISDNEIYEYACCPTKFYLNKSQEISDDNESLYLTHISETVENNRDKICRRLNPSKVSQADKNIYSETIKLMKKGEPYIQGSAFLVNDMLAKPFILEKVNKSSRFGRHSYQILDFIPSIQFNEEYKRKLAFQSYLLYFYIGFMPSNCKMLNIQQEILEFNPVSIFEEIRLIINDIIRIDYEKKKPISLINSHCKICRWKNKCLNECLERKDVSLLSGVTREKRYILGINNINRIEQIASLDNEKIEILRKQGLRNVQFIVKQANSYVTQKQEIISTTKLPKRYVALYFDIEGQIDLNFQYLFGIYSNEDKKYMSFWADIIDDEKRAFFALIKYLSKIKKYTLFHYGSYEKTVIRDLCFKYNLPDIINRNLQDSMVDIYSITKKCVAIPIHSYSLKDVAGYFGFKWRDKDALGVNSIIWHNNWIGTKDTKFKDRLLSYNEDDCKATKFVKEWLENNCK